MELWFINEREAMPKNHGLMVYQGVLTNLIARLISLRINLLLLFSSAAQPF